MKYLINSAAKKAVVIELIKSKLLTNYSAVLATILSATESNMSAIVAVWSPLYVWEQDSNKKWLKNSFSDKSDKHLNTFLLNLPL